LPKLLNDLPDELSESQEVDVLQSIFDDFNLEEVLSKVCSKLYDLSQTIDSQLFSDASFCYDCLNELKIAAQNLDYFTESYERKIQDIEKKLEKDEKIEPSATQSSSTKEEQKETSTKSESQTSTSSSMATPSTTMETKSETGKDLYKEVIERYNHYQALLISSGDRESLYEKLKQNKIFSEEYGYIFTLSTYDKPVSLHYVYADLNNDGQDELIIGDKKYIGAIYYLENKQPKLLHTAYVASAGGFRSSLVIYENGQVRYADWQSTRPEMNLSLYAFDKDGVQKIKEGIFQIGSDQKPEQILEISSNELDLAKFDWKEFEPVN